jgi:hypothetical protein
LILDLGFEELGFLAGLLREAKLIFDRLFVALEPGFGFHDLRMQPLACVQVFTAGVHLKGALLQHLLQSRGTLAEEFELRLETRADLLDRLRACLALAQMLLGRLG